MSARKSLTPSKMPKKKAKAKCWTRKKGYSQKRQPGQGGGRSGPRQKQVRGGIQKKRLGRDHPAVARTLNNMASVHQAQSKLPEALEGLKEALRIFEKRLGEAKRNARSRPRPTAFRRSEGGL